MSYTFCQRCNRADANSWTVSQAEFHVGRIAHWKVQLCPECTKAAEQAVLAILKAPSADAGTER